VFASLAVAGPAAAQTSFTCVFDGGMNTTAATYNLFSTSTGICAGLFAGTPGVATGVAINSAGDRSGDPCVIGTLSDSDGSGTTISSAGFTIAGIGVTIQAAAGHGAMTFGHGWTGAGAVRFATGPVSPGVCVPGAGPFYTVQGAFTIAKAPPPTGV